MRLIQIEVLHIDILIGTNYADLVPFLNGDFILSQTNAIETFIKFPNDLFLLNV